MADARHKRGIRMIRIESLLATDLASCVIPVIAACTAGEPGATETTGEKKDRTNLSFLYR